jgi:hypothetical protein
MLEVYSVDSEDEKPISVCVLDVEATSFDFLGVSDLVISDTQGNLSLLQGILS